MFTDFSSRVKLGSVTPGNWTYMYIPVNLTMSCNLKQTTPATQLSWYPQLLPSVAPEKEIAWICFGPQRTNWDHRNLMFKKYSEMRWV